MRFALLQHLSARFVFLYHAFVTCYCALYNKPLRHVIFVNDRMAESMWKAIVTNSVDIWMNHPIVGNYQNVHDTHIFLMWYLSIMMSSIGNICERKSPMNSPKKNQRRGALLFSLIFGWTNYWVNNREADDLRRHCAHYDVTVMVLFSVNCYGQSNLLCVLFCCQRLVQTTFTTFRGTRINHYITTYGVI